MLTALLLLALVVPTLLLTGCDETNDPYHIRNENRDWYARQTGEKIKASQTIRVNDAMSESHRMMANMILIRNGVDPDSVTAESFYLTKITLESGEEVAMVSLNNSKYK